MWVWMKSFFGRALDPVVVHDCASIVFEAGILLETTIEKPAMDRIVPFVTKWSENRLNSGSGLPARAQLS